MIRALLSRFITFVNNVRVEEENSNSNSNNNNKTKDMRSDFLDKKEVEERERAKQRKIHGLHSKLYLTLNRK